MAGEGKKTRNFAPSPSGPHPSGPHHDTHRSRNGLATIGFGQSWPGQNQDGQNRSGQDGVLHKRTSENKRIPLVPESIDLSPELFFHLSWTQFGSSLAASVPQEIATVEPLTCNRCNRAWPSSNSEPIWLVPRRENPATSEPGHQIVRIFKLNTQWTFLNCTLGQPQRLNIMTSGFFVSPKTANAAANNLDWNG